jgi:hypothetical protein
MPVMARAVPASAAAAPAWSRPLARSRTAGKPRARPSASPRLLALRGARVVVRGFFDDDGPSGGVGTISESALSDFEYAEQRAEDAIRRTIARWAELDARRATEPDHAALLAERERELDAARRDALERGERQSEALREAEAAAALWESRAKEVRRDLEFAQSQLEELRRGSSASSSGYGYGASSAPSAAERDALARAEDATHRLRQGEARAKEEHARLAAELDDVKRRSAEARDLVDARVRAAETRAEDAARVAEESQRELRVAREALDRDRNALHKDLETARARVLERDAVISETMRERDEARRVADERDGVIAAKCADVDKAHDVIRERDEHIDNVTRERDEARHTAWEREQHIEHVEKERDDARHVAWEREQTIEQRDQAIAEREKERDEARHVAWEREQTIEAMRRAFEELEEAGRRVQERAKSGREHQHQ